MNIWCWDVLGKVKNKTKAFRLEYTWYTERPAWLVPCVRGVGDGAEERYRGHIMRTLEGQGKEVIFFFPEGNGKTL